MNHSIFFGAGSAGNVRGKQVAELLGAKMNPTSGYEKDLCIYVKVIPPENYPLYSYLDIDDSMKALEWAKKHPKIGIIATSLIQKEFLKKELKRDDIFVIPHIHMNYENYRRPDRPLKVVGTIGSRTSMLYPVEKIRKRLKDIGLEYVYEEDYWKHYGDKNDLTEDQRRLKAVEFYKSIDLQIVWSKGAFNESVERMKNPNKLINAGAFGIPTVSYPNIHYTEWRGFFLEALSIPELIKTVSYLKENPDKYNLVSNIAFECAKLYHRDKIRKLYQNL